MVFTAQDGGVIAGRGSFHPRIFKNLKGGRTQKTKAKLVTERRGTDYRVSPLASSVGGQSEQIPGVRASPGAPNGDPDTRRRSVVLNDQWCPENPLKTGEIVHRIAFDISSTVLTFRPVPRTMTSYFSSILTKYFYKFLPKTHKTTIDHNDARRAPLPLLQITRVSMRSWLLNALCRRPLICINAPLDVVGYSFVVSPYNQPLQFPVFLENIRIDV